MGSHEPDAALVRAVGRGDSAAFEVLVRRHLPTAHGLAMSLLKDSDDADDVCQDAFLSALKRIGTLRDPAAFKGWLLSIVRNRSLSLLSNASRKAARPLDSCPGLSAGERSDQGMEAVELEGALAEAMEELTAKQKEVFLLHDLGGMNHGEVSTELGISLGSSRVHLHMARKALRTRLDRSQLEGV